MVLYGIDIVDPGLYDMVINLSSMGVDEAVNLITQASKQQCFQATEETQRKINDLALTAEIRAALFDFPTAGVTSGDGKGRISVKAPEEQAAAITIRIEDAVKNIEMLKELKIRVDPYF